VAKRARRTRGLADVWRAVAEEDGGRVIERKLKPPLIELGSGPWVTRTDTMSDPSGSGSTLTRFRTPYLPTRPFRLRIAKRGLFDHVAAWVGAGGIRVGRAEFDRRFTVRASGRGVARSLLLGTRLGERLLAQPDVRVELGKPGLRRRRELGPGVREAVVRYPRLLVDADELREAFALSWELVRELERVGVAKSTAP